MKISILLLLFEVASNVSSMKLIGHRRSSILRMFPSITLTGWPLKFNFNLHRNPILHDSSSEIYSFLRVIISGTRYGLHGLVNKMINDHNKISQISNQWIYLSSIDIRTLKNLLHLRSDHMEKLLLKILSMDILDRPPVEQYFLLNICAMIIERQTWHLTGNQWTSFYLLLSIYGDVVADYIPESAWMSLTLDKAEELLALNIEPVSSHIRNYKFLFAPKEMGISKGKSYVNLPYKVISNFIYHPEIEIEKVMTYHGKSDFHWKIELTRPQKSRTFTVFISFDAKEDLIPEFSLSIETGSGDSRLSHSLFFGVDELRTFINQQLSKGNSMLRFESTINSKKLVRGKEYKIIVNLMRLSPFTEYSSKTIHSFSEFRPTTSSSQIKNLWSNYNRDENMSDYSDEFGYYNETLF